MIFFRTDASDKIGKGHVTRCLKLASAMRMHGAECYFICRNHEGNLIKKIQQKKFKVCVLNTLKNSEKEKINSSNLTHSKWLGVDWKTDAKDTIMALGSKKADLIIIDHYAIDSRLEQELRPYTKKIMVIDDLADRNHDCDFLLNQNLGSSADLYKNLIPKGCYQFYGPNYALLDPVYQHTRSKLKSPTSKISRILIYFGSGKYTIKLIENILVSLNEPKLLDLKIDIVIDANIKNLSKIHKLLKFKKNVRVHSNLPDLAILMSSADIAIGAGGSTTWERCCMGLPTILVILAINQKLIGEFMHKAGAAIVLNKNKNLITQIKEAIFLLLNNKDLYTKMSKKAFSICDEKGINRVIKRLV